MSYIITKELLSVVLEEAQKSKDVDDFEKRLKNREPAVENEIDKFRGLVKLYASPKELKTNTDELLATKKPIEITKDGKKIGLIIPKGLL